MRWLIVIALAVPALAACGSSPRHATRGPAPPSFRDRPGPGDIGRQGQAGHPTLLSGVGRLSNNNHDSYAAWGTAIVSRREALAQIPVPRGSTVSNLHLRLTAAPGTGASWTFTVDKNGSPTALSCSISGATTSCNDASILTVVTGDTIDLRVTPFGSPALANIMWSATLAP